MNLQTHDILIIVIAAVVTILIRFLPFWIFDHGDTPPKWVVFLGRVLPSAVMSVLLIYCVRNISFVFGNHGIPEIIGIAVAIGLHVWKRNTLLSICVSTILYMLILRLPIW